MEWMSTIRMIYRRSKRALLYLDMIFVIIVFYGGQYLGSLRERLLPGAIVGGFAILLESLFAISDNLQEKVGITQYDSISQAIPKMVDLIKQGSRRKHAIKIIAASGGTTTNTIIPALMEQVAVPLDVSILIINPETRLGECIPQHWGDEARATLGRLRQIAGGNGGAVSLTCRLYDYLPCVHGVLIDEQHLFLGFFMWVESTGRVELSGAQQPHIYYRRAPSYENLFRLFETWFDSAPSQRVIPAV